jgi:hypothetical protein
MNQWEHTSNLTFLWTTNSKTSSFEGQSKPTRKTSHRPHRRLNYLRLQTETTLKDLKLFTMVVLEPRAWRANELLDFLEGVLKKNSKISNAKFRTALTVHVCLVPVRFRNKIRFWTGPYEQKRKNRCMERFWKVWKGKLTTLALLYTQKRAKHAVFGQKEHFLFYIETYTISVCALSVMILFWRVTSTFGFEQWITASLELLHRCRKDAILSFWLDECHDVLCSDWQTQI